MRWSVIVPALAVVALAACKDKDEEEEEGGDPESSAFLGIYELSTWTENASGCDSEGASVLENSGETHLLIRTAEFFITYLHAETCPDLDTCRAESSEDYASTDAWAFFEGDDDGGWEGGSSYGYDEDGACIATALVDTLSDDGSGGALIERRTYDLGDVGYDSDGWCDLPDDVAAAAEGKECQGLEVLTASFLEEI